MTTKATTEVPASAKTASVIHRIILIETSTDLCSVAISAGSDIISYKESSSPRTHASMTIVLIKEMLDEHNIKVKDCDAVCVSMGPGSYTGLRVGVSTAKGLCFGSGKPLLAVGTLDVLVYQALSEGLCPKNCRYIIPMVDARRMEVYTAVFNIDGEQITDTAPVIVSNSSFENFLDEGQVLFIGDGAGKCKSTIVHPNAAFIQCCPKASAMLIPALKEFEEIRFKDVAYFEPFYLKEFTATVSSGPFAKMFRPKPSHPTLLHPQ